MKNKKLFWIISAGIVGIFIFTIYTEKNNNSCVTTTETRTVRGRSMAGVIDEGRKVKILYGYYNCNPVQRGDVVAYQHAGDSNPIIKMVRGVPGDTFSVILSNAEESLSNTNPRIDPSTPQGFAQDDKKNSNGAKSQIIINGQPVTNSTGQPYLLNDQEARLLQLYEKDYQGKIPPDTYLILGNIMYGSLDSTKFGLAGKRDILGKVAY